MLSALVVMQRVAKYLRRPRRKRSFRSAAEDGADDHINKMAKKYLGVDKYPYAQPSEIRVIYKIQPEHTTVMG